MITNNMLITHDKRLVLIEKYSEKESSKGALHGFVTVTIHDNRIMKLYPGIGPTSPTISKFLKL